MAKLFDNITITTENESNFYNPNSELELIDIQHSISNTTESTIAAFEEVDNLQSKLTSNSEIEYMVGTEALAAAKRRLGLTNYNTTVSTEGISDFIKKVIDGIKLAFKKLWEFLVSLFEKIKSILGFKTKEVEKEAMEIKDLDKLDKEIANDPHFSKTLDDLFKEAISREEYTSNLRLTDIINKYLYGRYAIFLPLINDSNTINNFIHLINNNIETIETFIKYINDLERSGFDQDTVNKYLLNSNLIKRNILIEILSSVSGYINNVYDVKGEFDKLAINQNVVLSGGLLTKEFNIAIGDKTKYYILNNEKLFKSIQKVIYNGLPTYKEIIKLNDTCKRGNNVLNNYNNVFKKFKTVVENIIKKYENKQDQDFVKILKDIFNTQVIFTNSLEAFNAVINGVVDGLRMSIELRKEYANFLTINMK